MMPPDREFVQSGPPPFGGTWYTCCHTWAEQTGLTLHEARAETRGVAEDTVLIAIGATVMHPWEWWPA